MLCRGACPPQPFSAPVVTSGFAQKRVSMMLELRKINKKSSVDTYSHRMIAQAQSCTQFTIAEPSE